MRVVFMGTPDFAVPSLRALAARHDVVAVYTRPDKPRGRGRTLAAPPVKVVAAESGIPVSQPPTLKDADVIADLADLRPDVVCVAAYGLLLPDAVLEAPRLGCVNVHASLLPAYRGAAPIQRAILDGAPVTGVSIMRVVRELDAGPYAARIEVSVDELDADALSSELAGRGAEALLAVLEEMERGTVVWVAQDDSRATYAPKVSAEDVALHPGLTVVEALRRVRASGPSAPARASVAGTRVVVLAAERAESGPAPGATAVDKHGLDVGLSDGAIRLARVKPEGRAAMDGDAFARGARVKPDAAWGRWS